MPEIIPFMEIAGLVFIIMLLLGLRTRLRRTERKLALLLRYFQVDVNQLIPLSETVQELAKSGNKIRAIKQYRQETGVGLAEAKEAVEKWLDASA